MSGGETNDTFGRSFFGVWNDEVAYVGIGDIARLFEGLVPLDAALFVGVGGTGDEQFVILLVLGLREECRDFDDVLVFVVVVAFVVIPVLFGFGGRGESPLLFLSAFLPVAVVKFDRTCFAVIDNLCTVALLRLSGAMMEQSTPLCSRITASILSARKFMVKDIVIS